jgi:hypothetical protein
MVTRSAAVVVVAACAVLVAPASASHMQPAASIHLTDLGAQTDGSHKVRIAWETTCGPNAPNALLDESEYAVMIRPRREGAKPVTAGGDLFETPTGSVEATIAPGRRVFARVLLRCDDSGEVARATADSPETLFVPPRISGASVTRGSYCGRVSRRQRNNGIGASDFQTIRWNLQFGRTSMLKSPSIAGFLNEVRLRASGKGLRLRVGPASGPLRKYSEFQATIFSPPSGRVKLWAEIGGVSTNVISLPVVGKPCVRNPRKYYGAAVMRHANPFVRG